MEKGGVEKDAFLRTQDALERSVYDDGMTFRMPKKDDPVAAANADADAKAFTIAYVNHFRHHDELYQLLRGLGDSPYHGGECFLVIYIFYTK